MCGLCILLCLHEVAFAASADASDVVAAKKAAAEQVAQADREKRCTSFGYQCGSPDYSKCLESMYLQDRQLAAAEGAKRQVHQAIRRAAFGYVTSCAKNIIY